MSKVIKFFTAMLSFGRRSDRNSAESMAFERGQPRFELRFEEALKAFDIAALELSPGIAEMFEQRAKVRALSLAYLNGIGEPHHQTRAAELDQAEDKLNHLVGQNIGRLAVLRDRYVCVAAVYTCQSLVAEQSGTAPTALHKAAGAQLNIRLKAFTDKVAQIRRGREIEMPQSVHSEEQLRLLRESAALRQSGMMYSIEKEDSIKKEDTTAATQDLMNLNAHMCSW